ncbi:MAG: helix-turn-helix transcriptional regulator [Rhodobacteraceae bacterium]|nr:helix-turn-helix transcriptional regulator [Paracoccaceae bacterium]
MDTVTDPSTAARFERYDCSDGCPVEAALEQISGKWKGLAVYHLMDETVRFNELMRRLGTVTQRSLTKQLRELEADGIVNREVFAVVPPRVEYSLTPKGQALRTAILALGDWGKDHPRPDRTQPTSSAE